MNWKVTGMTLFILCCISGSAGLLAGTFVKAPSAQEAHWIIDCFNGLSAGCEAGEANKVLVRQWTDYGTYLAIGSAVVGMLGAGLFAGAMFSSRPTGD